MLKTDVINVSVTAALRFEHALALVELKVGQKHEWTLPQVLNAHMNSYEIVVRSDLRLERYLMFNKDSNTMFYNDLHGSSQLVDKFLEVHYTIIDSLDKNYSEN